MGDVLASIEIFDIPARDRNLVPLNQQSYLSALERGEKEPGAAVLLAISQEFGKSVDWLPTGKTHTEPKTRATGNSPRSD